MRYQMKPWSNITVTWNKETKEWDVRGFQTMIFEWEQITSMNEKKHAVEDALIYAFDTSAGPMRADTVLIYSKAGKLLSCKQAVEFTEGLA